MSFPLSGMFCTRMEERNTPTSGRDLMPPLSHALKVLIIDDDERALETYRAALNVEGYEVVTAMNAVDGARELTKSRPDAVLLDLHMQEVSEGLAFLRRLRSIDAYQTTPVAIITGDYAVDSAVESDLRGYGATIRFKPFWLDDLVALVRDLTTDLPRQSQ